MSTLALVPLISLNVSLAPAPKPALPFESTPVVIATFEEQSNKHNGLYEPIKPLDSGDLHEVEELTIITPKVVPRASIAGNDYVPGQCVWYAKNRRPDLPNSMGNANQWIASAQGHGIPTGSEPMEGAIGVSFDYYLGHVVYVESVNPDGSVNISEMNYEGPFIISYRTASASEFQYIY